MTARLEKRRLDRTLREPLIKKGLIDFASSDYLGLARSRILQEEIYRSWMGQEEPPFNGSTGSPLLTGYSSLQREVESQIAHFHHFEEGVLFGSGFMANIGLMMALSDEEGVFFFDEHIHASIKNGLQLSKTDSFAFRHNDLEHLEKRLKTSAKYKVRTLLVESLYSTDGSCAPLKELSSLGEKYGARLIVDEAHATGLFGTDGRGLSCEHGVSNSLFAKVVTFGKALGVYGAIVLGSKQLRDLLVNFAGSYIYSTALPPFMLHAIQASYKLFPSMDLERKKVHDLIRQFNGLSSTPIQPIYLQGAETARHVAADLQEKGFDVRALLSPTVQKNQERLRVTLHAYNTSDQIDALKKALST